MAYLRLSAAAMEIGLYTFAELSPDSQTGGTITPQQRVRDLLEEIELADQLGLDVLAAWSYTGADLTGQSRSPKRCMA